MTAVAMVPLSVTVIVSVNVPADAGVPPILPFEALIESAAGKPLADHVYDPLPPLTVIAADAYARLARAAVSDPAQPTVSAGFTTSV